jgi:hypothetical protein
MKKVIIALLVCIFSLALKAQNRYETDLKALHTEMAEATKARNLDRILDLTLPQIFKIAPRENLKEAMEKALWGDEDVKIDITKSIIDSVSRDILETKEGIYVLIFETKEMKMTFARDSSQTDDSHAEMLESMKGTFTIMYGEENIALDSASSTLTIGLKNGRLLAFNESPSKAKADWRFLQVTETDPLKQVLSKEVIKWIVSH